MVTHTLNSTLRGRSAYIVCSRPAGLHKETLSEKEVWEVLVDSSFITSLDPSEGRVE